MTITILTLFPEVFPQVFDTSIIGRAQKKGLLTIRLVNIRDFAFDKHKIVDDKPYGGGVGMLMRVDVVARAISESRIRNQESGIKNVKERVILLNPTGKIFTQSTARRLSQLDHLILVCGHYEGIDYRIHHFVDDSISIGKYVLTGGEIPAMVITDAVVRLIPKVLAKKEAVAIESYSANIIKEAPQYTRPAIFRGLKVPSVLMRGDHKKIALWKEKQTVIKNRIAKQNSPSVK